MTTQPNSATRDAESLGRPSLLATERKTQHWFIHKGRSLTDSIDRDFEPALPPPVNQILTLSLPTILFAAVSSEDKSLSRLIKTPILVTVFHVSIRKELEFKQDVK